MAHRSEVLRWLTLVILGTVILLTGQFFWVQQLHDVYKTSLIRPLDYVQHFSPESLWDIGHHPQRQSREKSYVPDGEAAMNSTFDLKSCIPDKELFRETTETPFKIFVYDLPRKFNYDIVKCVEENACFDLSYCGMGRELYRFGDISVRYTNQFSLEVVIHHQLLFSPYRTLDPFKADFVYVPAYTGLSCFCRSEESQNTTKIVTELFQWLDRQNPYIKGKQHFSALAKIEREQASSRCPLLRFPQSKKIIYAAIEEESNPSHKRFLKIVDQAVVVVPYPSYGHRVSGLTNHNVTKNAEFASLYRRNVFILMAIGTRKSNNFRVKLMKQFNPMSRTRQSYEQFFQKKENRDVKMVWLQTTECRGDHHYTTISWMQRSVFCLQPPGDSPTRKSFYDSIIAGCIPVLFQDKNYVTYPFEDYINYDDFTVNLWRSDVEFKGRTLMDMLSEISVDEIQDKLEAVQNVSKWLQYSLPNGKLHAEGAMELFMQEIGSILNPLAGEYEAESESETSNLEPVTIKNSEKEIT